MKKSLLFFALTATMAFAQYKAEPAGAPPADLAPAFATGLQPDGVKVVGPSGVFCEVWFEKTAPSGNTEKEESVALPTIPQGALLGVIRFPARGADRRGQTIKPGTYTMRYSLYPVNGDHQGVAPQRDFLLLIPAGDDKDPAAKPDFKTLVGMSTKASGTPHPAVFSITNSTATKFPNLSKQGDTDWVLDVKVGDLPVSMIVVGKAEG